VFAQNIVKHEVQSGETLYSLARNYGVTIDAIKQANPSIEGENIISGQVITIPNASKSGKVQNVTTPETTHSEAATTKQTPAQPKTQPGKKPGCKLMLLVEKKTTVYSICKEYGISEDDFYRANPQIEKSKIKKGNYVCIPYTAQELAQQRAAEEKRQAEQRAAEERARKEAEANAIKQYPKLNVAVILPFDLNSKNKSNEAIKVIDFYEGFLLAVENLKKQGVSVDIYAYEEKGTFTSSIDTILTQPMMPHMNLIVGPMRLEHIPAVTRFAKQHNIPHVVPFSTNSTITMSAPTTFQVNTAVKSLYSKVYQLFMERNPDSRVVFVNCEGNDKDDYIAGFKRALSDKGHAFQTCELSEVKSISKIVPETDKRLIFIPTSASQHNLQQLIRNLNANAASDMTQYNVSLFGYPEWQTFKEYNKQNMRKYNASIFATFYTNSRSSEVSNFNAKFKSWFKRDQFNSYPLFGLLGYDVGNFFISGLNKFGNKFCDRQSGVNVTALQNPMHFEKRSAENGFVNTSLKIISL
jgi:LysM repeat protein